MGYGYYSLVARSRSGLALAKSHAAASARVLAAAYAQAGSAVPVKTDSYVA